ncbi:MAG: DUF6078 family protein [Prevotella sp.]|nr:DUF6078 family protein [Prevotella sp.]
MRTSFTKEDFTGKLTTFWDYCFNNQCPMHDDCIHYVTGMFLDDGHNRGCAIFPSACHDGKCKYFRQARKIKVAWGFSKLFHDVRQRDTTTIRTLIKKYLGGHSTFYRYANGEYKLTPEQQEAVTDIFKQQGYTQNLEFDHYEYTPDLT